MLNFISQAFTHVSLVMSLSVIIIRMHGDCHFLDLLYAQLSQLVVSYSIISQVKLQVCIYFFFHIPIKCGWSVINLYHEEFTNLHPSGFKTLCVFSFTNLL